jgi:hypothetical protein
MDEGAVISSRWWSGATATWLDALQQPLGQIRTLRAPVRGLLFLPNEQRKRQRADGQGDLTFGMQ